MRNFLFYFLICILFFSCKTASKTNVDVSKVSVNFTLERFDVDFYTSSKENLQELKNKYPLLFPKNVHDSVWIHKITDKDEQELFTESQKIYKDISSLKEQLTTLFKHVKYYNPKFKEPNVITILTNIDYDNRVLYANGLMFISLDAYLGKDHQFYGDYPKYIKQNNTKDHIVVDVAKAIIEVQFPANSHRVFLSKIIAEGKKMYLLDAYLPTVLDHEKAGYSQEKLDWVVVNEERIWKYFIEKNLLYSTDSKLNQRFLDVAPFSKFYLAEDNKSPGQIGVFMGWKIVRAYMQNNDVSLRELLQKDSEEIFKKSSYKPKR